MKLSWKLFFITTPLLILFLTAFGLWMMQSTFAGGLELEIQQCLSESQYFAQSYELSSGTMPDHAEPGAIVAAFHQPASSAAFFRLYDAQGGVLYEDSGLRIASSLAG